MIVHTVTTGPSFPDRSFAGSYSRQTAYSSRYRGSSGKWLFNVRKSIRCGREIDRKKINKIDDRAIFKNKKTTTHGNRSIARIYDLTVDYQHLIFNFFFLFYKICVVI